MSYFSNRVFKRIKEVTIY